MNSLELKLTGLVELPEPLEINKDYLFSINAGITDVNKKSDEKGGFIYTHKAKLRSCEVLKSNGAILKGKVKGSESQKTKWAIQGIQSEITPEADPEQFYEETQQAIRRYLPEVMNLIKKLKGN